MIRIVRDTAALASVTGFVAMVAVAAHLLG